MAEQYFIVIYAHTNICIYSLAVMKWHIKVYPFFNMYVLATVNNASMDLRVHLSFRYWIFFEFVPCSRSTGYMVSVLPSIMLCTFTVQLRSLKGSLFWTLFHIQPSVPTSLEDAMLGEIRRHKNTRWPHLHARPKTAELVYRLVWSALPWWIGTGGNGYISIKRHKLPLIRPLNSRTWFRTQRLWLNSVLNC